MNEWILFIFINLVIFNLYFHLSQLIKMEKPINYFDDDDFWVMNFYGFNFMKIKKLMMKNLNILFLKLY